MSFSPLLLLFLVCPLLPSPSQASAQYSAYSAYSYPTYYPQSYPSANRFYPRYNQLSVGRKQTYSQGYPSYPSNTLYPQGTFRSGQQGSYSYPLYRSQPGNKQQQQQQAYQDPVFNYMLNDLSYFGPEVTRSTTPAPKTSRAPRNLRSPRTSLEPRPPKENPWGPKAHNVSSVDPLQSPAWQGKIKGKGATRCHDGTVLPFRARCNKVFQCSQGEDEFDCDWHKRSTILTISGVSQLERLLRENENVLVEFFAPWCPACITFLPHLEKIKATSADIPLVVVKVNTDDDPELKKLFSVDTYPRVMLWSKRWGESPTYMYSQYKTYEKNWGMTYDNVRSWLRSKV